MLVPRLVASPHMAPRRVMSSFCLPIVAGFMVGAVLMVIVPPGDGGVQMEDGNDSSSFADFFRGAFSKSGAGSSGKKFKHFYNTGVVGNRSANILLPPAPNTGAPTHNQDPEPVSPPNDDEEEGTPPWLEDTVFITLATGDESARDAVALMRSLREVHTRVPHLVVMLARGGVGSADCHNTTWKASVGRTDVSCSHLNTIAPEIASQVYLDAFLRMGVELMVVDPIPDTPYTIIPGGRQIFWGMAFNKLLVFNYTQYKKLIWLDSDAYIIKNIDHLMKEPTITGAMVTACCHSISPAYAGGGIWVLEPSTKLYNDLMDFIAKPVPGTKNDPWHWGDMQVIRHFFGVPPPVDAPEPLWPAINDQRNGYAPGLRYLPMYQNYTDEGWAEFIDGWLDKSKPRVEGFVEELWTDRSRPAWRALDVRYDQCVGHFQCTPERDAPDVQFSVHFSCLHDIRKPGVFTNEFDFMDSLYKYAESSTRYWFLRWYETYKSVMGRFPPPLWEGPTVPGRDAAHDEIVFANRIKRDAGGGR